MGIILWSWWIADVGLRQSNLDHNPAGRAVTKINYKTGTAGGGGFTAEL